MSKTILERLGITQEELEERYRESGTLRALSDDIGVSKTTLQKYLKHVAKDTKPWDSVKNSGEQHNIDYLRRKHRASAMQQLEDELLTARTYTDINGRVIPRDAIRAMKARPPEKFIGFVTVDVTLRDGTKTYFLMPLSDQEPAEHSSAEGIHYMNRPATS